MVLSTYIAFAREELSIHKPPASAKASLEDTVRQGVTETELAQFTFANAPAPCVLYNVRPLPWSARPGRAAQVDMTVTDPVDATCLHHTVGSPFCQPH